MPFIPLRDHMMAQSRSIPIGAAADGSLISRYPQVRSLDWNTTSSM
jgi:hypothetical protein